VQDAIYNCKIALRSGALSDATCENNVDHISAVLGENSSVMCMPIAAEVVYALERCFFSSLCT